MQKALGDEFWGHLLHFLHLKLHRVLKKYVQFGYLGLFQKENSIQALCWDMKNICELNFEREIYIGSIRGRRDGSNGTLFNL